MAITPIIPSTPVIPIDKSSGVKSDAGSAFDDIFKQAVNNVNTAEQQANMDTLNVATGQSDDLHTLMISSEKAELALMALVQVRNKALDAYNEIMRISL
jgi:flagellar hook-basal body complex protein FliE